MKNLIITLTMATALIAPAHAGGYVKTTKLEQVEAYCNQVAAGQRRGFFAFGSQQFVGATALGHGIGSLIRRSQAKRDCMIMHGYKKAK